MKIDHFTDHRNEKVTVTVTVEPRTHEKIVIRQNDVRKYLFDKVKVGNCLQNNTVSNAIAPHTAQWIFQIENPDKKVAKLSDGPYIDKEKFDLDTAPKTVVKLSDEKIKPPSKKKPKTTHRAKGNKRSRTTRSTRNQTNASSTQD